MREIKPRGIALQRASWHDPEGRPQLVISALVGFKLTQHRQLLAEDVVWQLFSLHTSENSICDLWMEKPQGEVLVWGHAHSPQPTMRMEVSVCCGPVSRTLQVSGDRHWQPGLLGWKASPATPFTSMPLTWQRTFGGAGLPQCPLGVGLDSMQRLAGKQVAPLPNIESLEDVMRTPDSRPRSVGFAPVWPTWATTKNRGTFDKEWLANYFPGMPRDFDTSMFNLAQPEQLREGFWTGHEPYRLKGLHPTLSQLEGHLPDLQLRCFAERANEVSEVPIHLDTVAFFPSQEVGVLIFRGVADNVGVDGRNLTGLMAAAEWRESPRPAAHYHSEFATRLSSNSPYSFPDEPLMPVITHRSPAEVQPASEPVAAPPDLTVKPAAAATAGASALDISASQVSLEALESGLPTQNATRSGQATEDQDVANNKADVLEMVSGKQSRESFLEESKANLEQFVSPMRSLVSAIEQQPNRDISELTSELFSRDALGATMGAETMQAVDPDWAEWIPDKLAQQSLAPEERAQIATQLRGWIEGVESALSVLGEHASNSDALLEQLQQATASDFSEALNPFSPELLLNGCKAPHLHKLIESLGAPIDSHQLVQLMQSGISEWKSNVNGALAAQNTWSELLKPSTLHAFVQSLAGEPTSKSQELTQTANPLLAAFRAYLPNSLEDTLPEGPKKAFAEIAQAWSEEKALGAEIASALSQASEVRSVDELVQLIDRLYSTHHEPATADEFENSLGGMQIQTDIRQSDVTVSSLNMVSDDLKQLRADAVSEPVFAVPASAALLRKLVVEQAASGESMAGRDLAGADLRNLNFEGHDLTGTLLEGANLSGANLRNSKLNGAVFLNANLSQADLSGAQGARTNFRNVLAEGSVWRHACLTSCELKGANLSHANLQGITLKECDFGDANLSHVDLSQSQCVQGTWLKARLGDACLSNIHWSSCNLSEANLDRLLAEDSQMHFCDFTDTTGIGTNLSGSNLEGSRFLGAHLPDLNASHICAPGSSWVQSTLPCANFTSAQLSHALLSEANLASVSFERADLQGAVLNASVLSHSNFSRAKLASVSLRAADARGASFAYCDLLGADFNGTVIDACDFTQSLLHPLQLRVTHQPI